MDYEYMLESAVPNTNVIPAHASIGELATYAVASFEESYNNIMESIGISELAYVMEEGNADGEEAKKNIFKKFGEWIKNLWEKFQGFVLDCRNRLVTFINEKIYAIKKVATKYKGTDLADAIGKSDDSDWTFLKVKVDYYPLQVDQLATCIDNMYNDAKGVLDSKKDVNDEDFNEVLYKSLIAKLGGAEKVKVTSKNVTEIATVRAAAREIIAKRTSLKDGAAAKAAAKEDVGSALKCVADGNLLKKRFDDGIKKSYKDLKTNLNKALKDAKKADKTHEFKPLFKATKAITQVASAIVNECLTAIFDRTFYLIKVLNKGLHIYNKQNKGKKKVNESYFGSTTFQSELSSLFEF